MTNICTGVLTQLMQLSNIKIINKIINLKAVLIKTGIFMSLAVYWGVILVGTPKKIKKGVIKKPPPTPNNPESTPTIALNKSISTGLINT